MSSTKQRGRGQRSSWSSSRAGSRGRKSNEGLGAAGKFTFASRVCAVGKFPPSPQGQVGFWLKQSSLHRARSSVCMQALGPYRSQRATPCQALAGAWALRTLSAIHVEFLPELAHFTALPSAQLPSSGTSTAFTVVKYSPGRLPLPPCRGIHGPDKGKRRTRGPDRRRRSPLGKWCPGRYQVARKCRFPFCDDDTSPLPLPLSHGELTQLSLNQGVQSL